MTIEQIRKKVSVMEELQNRAALSPVDREVRLMSDEELSRRVVPIMERRAMEDERIGEIVKEKKRTHPDRWVIESILQMRREGLLEDGRQGNPS